MKLEQIKEDLNELEIQQALESKKINDYQNILQETMKTKMSF
jgi:hypothetical protein